MSIAGGHHLAVDLALRAGCDCLQIFVKNQRQWEARRLADDEVQQFRKAMSGSGLESVVAHASYLINLASPDAALRKKSIAAMIDELTRCEALGVPLLIVHPGAHMGAGVDAGIASIAGSLDSIHKATAGFSTRVALEGTAGQGTAIGHQFEHLGHIINSVRDPGRLRVCLDTCHLYAAGHNLADTVAFEAMMDDLEGHVGHDKIACMHTNDSMAPCGSRIDRHEHITKGRIGRKGFENILNDPRLAKVPRILETPKDEDGRGVRLDRLNLKRLRSMVMCPDAGAGRAARVNSRRTKGTMSKAIV
jgi:deoxyribonuclease IV